MQRFHRGILRSPPPRATFGHLPRRPLLFPFLSFLGAWTWRTRSGALVEGGRGRSGENRGQPPLPRLPCCGDLWVGPEMWVRVGAWKWGEIKVSMLAKPTVTLKMMLFINTGKDRKAIGPGLLNLLPGWWRESDRGCLWAARWGGEAFQNVISPYQLLNWFHAPRDSSQILFLRLETKALYPVPVYPASQKPLLCNAGCLLEFGAGMLSSPSQDGGGGGKKRISFEKVYSLTKWITVLLALGLPSPWQMLLDGEWWEGPPP